MELTFRYFSEHIGKEFEGRLEAAGRASPLTLEEAIELPIRHTKKPGIRKDPFSLIFKGGPEFARRIAILNLPGSEKFISLYLEPLGIEEGKLEYEVIIG